MMRFAWVLIAVVGCSTADPLAPLLERGAPDAGPVVVPPDDGGKVDPPDTGPPKNPGACVKAVAAGDSFNCALKTNNETVCWGQNNQNQVSQAPSKLDQLALGFARLNGCGLSGGVPVCWGSDLLHLKEETPKGAAFKEIAMGPFAACAVKTAGGITCWGGVVDLKAPASGAFSHVTTGGQHGCALTDDGTATCFGSNEKAELQVPPGAKFKQIDAGEAFTCGVKTDDTLVCWGDPQHKRLEVPAGTFSYVSAGSSAGCAIRTDGTVACWGEGGLGRVNPPGGTFSMLDASNTSDRACGVTTDKSVVCWGLSDASGELSGAPGPCTP